MVIKRSAIHLVALDTTLGAETAKTHPYMVISPNEVNSSLATVIIAPMTTVRRHWPTRPEVSFRGKIGEIAVDQLRAVDKSRLVKQLGALDAATANTAIETLAELFAP